ncbi:ABC transporter ATP-binding protein [Maritalea sp. S77]|uniref:ABC transporter ATP-binding protein n=1 Tax=Maritalea sp. S77 TaxID=3415125 RepID=UPI003C7CAFA8
MSAIELNNLNIAYSSVQVVHSASLTVNEGESFALVGESGSGKSTILKAICGLNDEWTGEIKLYGEKVDPRKRADISRISQMVFQDPYGSLHPRKTVDTTLSEPLAIHGIKDNGDRIIEMLDAVGLDQRYRFRFPHQMSGGQRQRVAIARALMLKPKLMLLDEPTSALDVSVQAEILNLLKQLRASQNLTFLLVTHDLPVVSFLCDRLAVMKKGKIVEIATRDQLAKGAFDDPYSQELYHASKHEHVA